MFESYQEVGQFNQWKPSSGGLAAAIGELIASAGGISCPHGCKGKAIRKWGLVSHLMGKHGYTLPEAKRKAGYG